MAEACLYLHQTERSNLKMGKKFGYLANSYGMFKCPICGLYFYTIEQLNEHVLLIHGEKDEY